MRMRGKRAGGHEQPRIQSGRAASECHAKCILSTFLSLRCGMHLIRYILVHSSFDVSIGISSGQNCGLFSDMVLTPMYLWPHYAYVS